MWACLQTESDYIGCLKYFPNFNLLNQVKELVAHFTSLFGICAAHISFVSRQRRRRELWPSIYCLCMHESLDNLSVVLNL